MRICQTSTKTLTSILSHHHPYGSNVYANHFHFAAKHGVGHVENASSYYAALLKSCAVEKNFPLAIRIHAHMKESGFPDLSLGNKLIDCYLKCGSIEDAREVFEKMPSRHVVAWNSLISSYASCPTSWEALQLYRRMLVEKVVPDEYTMSSIVKAFVNMGLLHEGRQAHAHLLVFGLEATSSFLGSALVSLYTKCGSMREARLILDGTERKDMVLITSFIVGCTQNGEDREALETFIRMVNDGFLANEFAFSSVLIACGNLAEVRRGRQIHGLVIKCGYEFSVHAQTSLLTMYSNCRLIDNSLQVFGFFPNPNIFTWTAIITALVQNGREEYALCKFGCMISESVLPNCFTLSAVLSACSSLSMFQQGKQIHALSIKSGLDTNSFVGTALVDTYGKCGTITLAQSVFESLGDLQLVSVTSMIYGYAINGCGHEALKLFNRMLGLGLEPNNAIFTSVLLACSNSGLLSEGRKVFSLIKGKFNMVPTNDHYACMIDLLGRAGKLDEAENLTKEVGKPDLVIWKTLLSACKIHRNVEIAERAAKNVLKLDPEDAGTHILLSNIYASLENWDGVIKTKSSVRSLTLRKEPAMSWIELDREVHTFTAGDVSHPKHAEIQQELEELIIKARGLGYVPDTSFVLQNFDENEKVESLYYHSEKLAVAFGVLSSRENSSFIRILKNLRICGDCHSWIKFVSIITGIEIIVRDIKRFHHFKDGACSCRDYW